MDLALQSFLFEKKPSRMELLGYTPTVQLEQYHIQIFRNHSFELIEHTIPAYLDYAGMNVRFSYSGYDDSLSFLELDSTADMLILWIDTRRYAQHPIQPFLEERFHQLRSVYSKPVLLVPFGESVKLSQPGVMVWNLDELQKEMGDRFLDERARDVSGTSLSRHAMMRISELLGLQYVPALLCPPLKAVVVDLDNTLYAGVLGEDGAEKLVLTEGHRQLQAKLKQLAGQGLFLCAASKNDIRDVEHLFSVRKDFPLQKEDFTFIAASWESKAAMIRDLAGKLNINPDSMLFLDDNIGELQTVVSSFPSIKAIHALDDAAITAHILEHYPGIMRVNTAREDSVRKQDVQANLQRQELQNSMSPEEYICSLQLQLVFDYDNPAQLLRISELANKTNQFIFNYKRYSQAEVEQRLSADDYRIVTISLSDRLSDSGLIGVCVGHALGDHVEIEECFISCRALGRGIDDVIVLGAIEGICESFGAHRVRVAFQKGPRNVPAEKFVEDHLLKYLDEAEEFSYSLPENLLSIKSVTHKEE